VLNYSMDWAFLISITSLAVIGILIGNKLQKKFSAIRLRMAFGWMILAMGSWILLKELVLH
jgi:uncharacterized protein